MSQASTGSSEPSSPTSGTSSLSTPPSSVSSPHIGTVDLGDPKAISDADKAEALKLKQEANKAFSSHDYPTAAKLYSESIEKNPHDATVWCNRAFTRIKLEEFGYALTDASQAIQIDPKYVKAYYRRATCHLQTLKYQGAISDFKKVVALEPKNETVKAQLTSTQKLLRKIEFEKAIEMEGDTNPVETCREMISNGSCNVPSDYPGPKLSQDEDGKMKVTIEFIRAMMEWFKDGKALPKRYVWEIVLGAYDIFRQEETLVDVKLQEGVTCDVIGDVHGQYFDLLHLYSLTGLPSETHYLLMNGDLVDRGSWSIEVILTAFAFKWLYPKFMYINRGNHEAKEMNRNYGFEGEAVEKHGDMTFKLFTEVFCAMPLATLVSATKPPVKENDSPILTSDGLKRFFVVHGGLFSKDDVTLDDIRNIPRLGRQPAQEGLMHELLWTDPQNMPGRGPSKRGLGIAFGPDVTRKWCKLNSVTGIIRSHEVRQDGYEIEHDGLCTTVFSAPNYVDQSGNKGAFIRIDSSGKREYTQFDAVPHPPLRPMAYMKSPLSSLMMGM